MSVTARLTRIEKRLTVHIRGQVGVYMDEAEAFQFQLQKFWSTLGQSEAGTLEGDEEAKRECVARDAVGLMRHPLEMLALQDDHAEIMNIE